MRGWSERIQVDGADADFEAAVARVRAAAERIGRDPVRDADRRGARGVRRGGIDVAVVEAGLGGRLDATNVLDAPVVVLTNVSLDHTDVLGDTREAIAAEKLAVVREGATVVLGEPEWEGVARAAGAAQVVTVQAAGERLAPNLAVAATAASAFLGRDVGKDALQDEEGLPGRYELRSPHELRDGAHNPAGAAHPRARSARSTPSWWSRSWPTKTLTASCASWPRSAARSSPRPPRAAALSLHRSWPPGPAHPSRTSNPSLTPPPHSSAHASSQAPTGWFSSPARCTFSRISMPSHRPRSMRPLAERLSVFVFAVVAVLAIVGLAFAAGYLVGQLLL